MLMLDCICAVGAAELADRALAVANKDDEVAEVLVDAKPKEAEEEGAEARDAEADDRFANATICASRD